MPEGDSIKRIANAWSDFTDERLILTSPQGRFSGEAARLTGSKFTSAEAHGKHLFLEFEHQQFIHVHLGLYGRFLWHKRGATPEPKPTTRLRAVHEAGMVELSGPTVCELITPARKQLIHARLGIDPLRPQDSIKTLLPWLQKSSWPIGKTLMEQSKIAGIGNVYRAEILFMLGVNPWIANKDVSKDNWNNIWLLSQELLSNGVTVGHIKTTTPNLPPPVTLPPTVTLPTVMPQAYVYMRTGEPCFSCSTPIEMVEFYSRRLYYCPNCQNVKTLNV